MSALAARALRKSYDGVEVVSEQLPAPLLAVAKALPLYHGVQIAIYFARKRFSS